MTEPSQPSPAWQRVALFVGSRRGRTWIVLALIVVAMGYALWWGLSRLTDASDPTKSRPSDGCSMVPASIVRAPSVNVDVLNGANVSGLANDVADKLRKQGFSVANVANAPSTQKTKIVARDPKSPQATLVASFFPGAVVESDGRYSPNVDVILGTNFTQMNLKAAARIEVPQHQVCPTPTGAIPTATSS